jgi:hypothetical protein
VEFTVRLLATHHPRRLEVTTSALKLPALLPS